MTKRVLFVDHDLVRTGSTVSLEYLVTGFANRGFKVTVLTSKEVGRVRPFLDAGAEVMYFRQFSFFPLSIYSHFTNVRPVFSLGGALTVLHDILVIPWGVLSVGMAIVRVRPDLVYVNEHVLIQASIAARILNVPSVMHIRSQLLSGIWGIRRSIIVRAILRWNARIFAITRLEAEQLLITGKRESKVKIVGEFCSNPVLPISETDDCRSIRAAVANKHAVAFLGGIASIKGTLVFLQSALRLVEEITNVMIILAGRIDRNKDNREGYFERCMEIVNSLKKRESIYVVGETANPLCLIASSEVLVSSSTVSHFSRPIVEAWMYGKPVIASRTPHAVDLIDDGVTGLLYEPLDPNMLLECLRRLISDKILCARLGEQGKAKAESQFNADKNVQTIVNECEGVLGG